MPRTRNIRPKFVKVKQDSPTDRRRAFTPSNFHNHTILASIDSDNVNQDTILIFTDKDSKSMVKAVTRISDILGTNINGQYRTIRGQIYLKFDFPLASDKTLDIKALENMEFLSNALRLETASPQNIFKFSIGCSKCYAFPFLIKKTDTLLKLAKSDELYHILMRERPNQVHKTCPFPCVVL